MKIKGIIMCPEHGKFKVTVEDLPVVEYRYVITGNFGPVRPAKQCTAKCPKCGKRLIVIFTRKKNP